ncbi:MAG: hypothetical protein M3Q29_16805 [Chloroflexota bacterium]|nr:hypothetical protein [Chloroflexota bacterium]
MATVEEQHGLAEAHELYDRYVKVLESEHWGEFVAVTPDGRTFLGMSKSDVLDQLLDAVGPGSGSYVFRVGPRVVGRWR